jgi:hypothetical protein
MTQVVSLTDHEQQCLSHLNRAQKQGLSLKAYADAEGLRVGSLYQTKSQLKKKGLLDAPVAAEADFLAVDVASASGPAVLRLRHPSGWELECAAWPPVDWLQQVLWGEADAPR